MAIMKYFMYAQSIFNIKERCQFRKVSLLKIREPIWLLWVILWHNALVAKEISTDLSYF